MSLIIPEHVLIPACPKDVDELGMLFYALTSDKFDLTAEELERKTEEEANRLRSKGVPERLVNLYTRVEGNSEDTIEARDYMLRWGRDRNEAIKRYMAHFKQPCSWCCELYTNILSDVVIERMKDDGISPSDTERIEQLLNEVDLQYIGNPSFNTQGRIRLEDIHPRIN